MQREQLIEQLGQENVPEEARKAILAARATTLSLLQDLVTDETLAGPEDPGEGWIPVQAVRLLCAMGDTTAIETLIELLAVVPDDSELGHSIMEELPSLGAMIVDPAIDAIGRAKESGDDYVGMILGELLVDSEVEDERIYNHLLSLLEETPAVGVELLAAYGDKRALPLASKLLEKSIPMLDGATGEAEEELLEDIIAAADAVITLGGELTEAQITVSESAMKRYAAMNPALIEHDTESDDSGEAPAIQ